MLLRWALYGQGIAAEAASYSRSYGCSYGRFLRPVSVGACYFFAIGLAPRLLSGISFHQFERHTGQPWLSAGWFG